MVVKLPVTVVETPEFVAATRRLMPDDERELLAWTLATNPTAGALIPGTGGVRKLRWRLDGRGKRGGARVIYYFHSPTVPLFLITAFAKNARDDLTQAERNQLRALTLRLVGSYGTGVLS